VYVRDHFRSDLGFIRRADILEITPKIESTFWPKENTIQKHSFSEIPIFIWKPELNFQNSEYAIISRWQANLKNNSEFSVEMNNRYTYLYENFGPRFRSLNLKLTYWLNI
jgi:hypothetical protein